MPRPRALSQQALAVLGALAADAGRWRHGYDLAAEVGLKSGSLYPLLIRLAERGLLESGWDEARGGKPPRHLYRITAAGTEQVAAARSATTRRQAVINAGRTPLGRARLGGAR